MWALLGFIPQLLGLVERWQAKKVDAQVAITTAKLGGDRDKAIAVVQAQVAAEHENTAKLGIMASNKLLTFLLISFSLPLVVFFWKVVVYDKVLGMGSTDHLTKEVLEWANTVMYFLFGAPTALALGKLFVGRT